MPRQLQGADRDLALQMIIDMRSSLLRDAADLHRLEERVLRTQHHIAYLEARTGGDKRDLKLDEIGPEGK